MLRARPGENWRRSIPVGGVLSTTVLAGMAQMANIEPLNRHAIHDGLTETGCAAGLGRTRIDAWYDFSPGRWLWPLAEAKPLREPSPGVGHQSFWHWDTDGGVSARPKHGQHIGRGGRETWPCPVSGKMETDDPSALIGTSWPTYRTTSAAKRGARWWNELRPSVEVPGATTGQRQHRMDHGAAKMARTPARFDELDKQQASALIATLRRHAAFRRTTAWVAGHPEVKTPIDAARFRK